MVKKRTLNELRQSKDFGYKAPIKKEILVEDYCRNVNFDCQHVVDLIKEYPNNTELGKVIRGYYESLK